MAKTRLHLLKVKKRPPDSAYRESRGRDTFPNVSAETLKRPSRRRMRHSTEVEPR